MRKYAERTVVSPDKSRAEIESTLRRYGATKFVYGSEETFAMIAFEIGRRRLRFILPFPKMDDIERTPSGRIRKSNAAEQAIEQATRQRWRALALAIKAKLETVESGITTFDDEFLAYIVLPNGSTIGEWSAPQLEQAYNVGGMPPMLPMPKQSERE